MDFWKHVQDKLDYFLVVSPESLVKSGFAFNFPIFSGGVDKGVFFSIIDIVTGIDVDTKKTAEYPDYDIVTKIFKESKKCLR